MFRCAKSGILVDVGGTRGDWILRSRTRRNGPGQAGVESYCEASLPTYQRTDYVQVEFPDETTGIGAWMWASRALRRQVASGFSERSTTSRSTGVRSDSGRSLQRATTKSARSHGPQQHRSRALLRWRANFSGGSVDALSICPVCLVWNRVRVRAGLRLGNLCASGHAKPILIPGLCARPPTALLLGDAKEFGADTIPSPRRPEFLRGILGSSRSIITF
jgi:hypothetical protein